MTMLADRHRLGHGLRSSLGFAITEVLVSIVLLAAVAGGLTMTVAGAGRVHLTGSASNRMSQVAEGVYERVSSERKWIDGCAATSCTNLTPGFLASVMPAGYATDPTLKVTFNVAVDGTPVFNGKPKPDYVRVRIEITVPTIDQRRLGISTPIVYEGVVSNTDSEVGSVVVQVCATRNQHDERMSIAGCTTAYAPNIMKDCPPSIFCPSYDYLKANQGLFPPTPTNPTIASMVYAVGPGGGYNFQLRGIDSGTAGVVRTAASAAAVYLGNGQWRFDGLPVGQYEITGNNIRGYEPWDSHTVPSGDLTTGGSGKVAVERDTTSRALLMYRKIVKGKYDVFFQRTIHTTIWEKKLQIAPPVRDDSDISCSTGRLWTCLASGTVPGVYGWGDFEILLVRGGLQCNNNTVACTKDIIHEQVWHVDHVEYTVYLPYTTDTVVPGAANNGTISLFPEPFGRITTGTGTNTRIVTPAIAITGQTGFCPVSQAAANCGTKSKTLPITYPGLYSPVGSAGSSSSLGTPVDADPPFIWVNPDNGCIWPCTLGSNNLTLRANGECYQRVAAFGGPLRMECNSCPYWPPLGGYIAGGNCAMLLESTRYYRECFFSADGEQFYIDAATGLEVSQPQPPYLSSVICEDHTDGPYSPPQVCSSLDTSTCQNGRIVVPQNFTSSPAGGTVTHRASVPITMTAVP